MPRVNVPAALGVFISLIGFSFLLKLAIDHGWLDLPIGARHVLVAVAGLGLTAAGWRLRFGPAAFSRTLLGGGLATLSLTVYSAAMVFHLLDAATGFATLLAIVGVTGFLATHLRSRTLAILGLVGGLSAPLLLPDDGVGLAHVFAYYSVFSAATLGLSLRHTWPTFHLLSFLGTFGSATLWALHLDGPASTGPVNGWIVVLFFLYLAVALANVLRHAEPVASFVDRTLILGTPSVSLALAALVGASSNGLALRSVGIAVVYAACAYLMHRRDRFAPWGRLFAATGVAFAVLAVPLALDGTWITLAWSTGAALQTWVAVRHGLRGHVWAAVGLFLMAGVHYLGDSAVNPAAVGAPAYLHAVFVSGTWLALAALVSSWWVDRHSGRLDVGGLCPWMTFGIGMGAWVAANGSEIARLVEGPGRVAAFIAFFAVTALVGDRTRWTLFRQFAPTYTPVLLVMLMTSISELSHPLSDGGVVAWPLALGVLALLLRSQQGLVHGFGLWTLNVIGLVVSGWEIHYQVARFLGGEWPLATVTTLLAAWTAQAAWRHGGTSVARDWILATAGGALGLMLAWLQLGDGSAPPLPFVPLLNPTDVAAVVSMAALWMVLPPHGRSPSRGTLLGLMSAGCLTMTVLRSVHHFAGVPFAVLDLWGSMTAQTALTVTWATTGLAMMVGGTWRAQRGFWVAGAISMAVVVAKLFLVDLSGVNTGARIVSFLGVGGLLIAVGYLAPAPPSEDDSSVPSAATGAP